jgi:hypothetical protein
MSSTVGRILDLRFYGRVLWRRRGIVVLCLILTCGAAVVALRFVPSVYESDVTLTVNDRILDPEALIGSAGDSTPMEEADDAHMAMLVARIRSRPFLERVIRTLQMNEDPAIRARAEDLHHAHPGSDMDELAIGLLVESLQSRIEFSLRGPRIFRVTVSDYDAATAQTLAKWISELFVGFVDTEAVEQIRSTREFAREQLLIYSEELDKAEAALIQFEESSRGGQPDSVRSAGAPSGRQCRHVSQPVPGNQGSARGV